MRTVLLVGMANSVHVARIVNAAARGGWRVLVFPSFDAQPHPALTGGILLDPTGRMEPGTDGVRVQSVLPRATFASAPFVRALSLANVIRTIRPDVIHAQQVQQGGYLATDAVRFLRGAPPVILTIWGSDLSLEARRTGPRRRILETLRRVDVLTAECERDLRHARSLGYAGETVPPSPVAGGFDLDRLAVLRATVQTSERRAIALKGYQSWSGRAQVALRAIERCGSSLRGYRLLLYLAGEEMVTLARSVTSSIGMELEVVSTAGRPVSHDEILAMHGRSRVSIGLSIADGISTSFLEAIVMGAFPIQSETACVSEWIEDGIGGLIVPAEDPNAVAHALMRAVSDDRLVDEAARVNDGVVERRLNQEAVQSRMLMLYERVAHGAITRAGHGSRAAQPHD